MILESSTCHRMVDAKIGFPLKGLRYKLERHTTNEVDFMSLQFIATAVSAHIQVVRQAVRSGCETSQ